MLQREVVSTFGSSDKAHTFPFVHRVRIYKYFLLVKFKVPLIHQWQSRKWKHFVIIFTSCNPTGIIHYNKRIKTVQFVTTISICASHGYRQYFLYYSLYLCFLLDVVMSQILGFDILMMKNLKPVLLEVNSNPSMRIEHEQEVRVDVLSYSCHYYLLRYNRCLCLFKVAPGVFEYVPSPVDEEVKVGVIRDTLRLMDPCPKKPSM